MAEEGPFLWIGPYAPPAGFRHVPYGAMCLSVFLFVRRGGKVLVGRYREHPEWERLTGMDDAYVRSGTAGWTLPARQLKFGEDPREAARQIGEEVLGLRGLEFTQPRVEVETWVLGAEADGPPERQKERHFDVWFFVDATLPSGAGTPEAPPWYAELDFVDAATTPASAWARMHEDVVARWAAPRPRP